MASHRGLLRERTISTLYIGGGTPTALSASQLDRLLETVSGSCRPADFAEVTVEVNPATVTAEKLAVLSRRGVTRLSIGAQAFSDEILARLGRIHSAADSLNLFHAARNAGFRNIGIDLIYGIPGQSRQQWLDSLDRALGLGPEHLSLYALSLDEGSLFKSQSATGRFTLPDDDTITDQYAAAVDLLLEYGYEQYEISNFSVPGKTCRHNRNYWDRGEYLGLGPGAWSFLGNKRCATVSDLDEYCSRSADGRPLAVFEEMLQPEQAASEMLALGLRTAAGVDLEHYALLAGRREADALLQRLEALNGDGLIRMDGTRFSLTRRGMLLSNEVVSRIIP